MPNLLSKDWRKPARFYIDVFNCKTLFSERDMQGDWIAKMTNIENVHIAGIHVQLHGCPEGPTLEIFTNDKPVERSLPTQINEIDYTYIEFQVEIVKKYVNRILAHGGSFYEEIVYSEIKDIGHLTAVYMRDPEKILLSYKVGNSAKY